jgi:hypothetical protein
MNKHAAAIESLIWLADRKVCPCGELRIGLAHKFDLSPTLPARAWFIERFAPAGEESCDEAVLVGGLDSERRQRHRYGERNMIAD